jgi:hypothetical protein
MRQSLTRRAPLVAVLVASACGGGSGSNPVNPSPTSNCTVSVNFNTTTFPAEGGSITGQVTASRSDCGWAFQGRPSWVTVQPASGTGSGTVVATASATMDARSGDLFFEGHTVPVMQVASAEADNLGFAVARCHTVARRGVTTPGACTITPRPGRNPGSTGIRVTADMRAFGRSETYGLVYVLVAGEWDLDVPVPADFPAGTLPITFRITDAQGRSATITVPLVVQ